MQGVHLPSPPQDPNGTPHQPNDPSRSISSVQHVSSDPSAITNPRRHSRTLSKIQGEPSQIRGSFRELKMSRGGLPNNIHALRGSKSQMVSHFAYILSPTSYTRDTNNSLRSLSCQAKVPRLEVQGYFSERKLTIG